MSNITNETSKILGIAKLRGIPRLQRSLFPSDYEKLKR